MRRSRAGQRYVGRKVRLGHTAEAACEDPDAALDAALEEEAAADVATAGRVADEALAEED